LLGARSGGPESLRLRADFAKFRLLLKNLAANIAKANSNRPILPKQ
jgi:hypothetical protein